MRKIISSTTLDGPSLFTIPIEVANKANLNMFRFGEYEFTQWFNEDLSSVPLLDLSDGVKGRYVTKSFENGLLQLRELVKSPEEVMFVFFGLGPEYPSFGQWFRVGVTHVPDPMRGYSRVGTIDSDELNSLGVNIHTHPEKSYVSDKSIQMARGISEPVAELRASFMNTLPSVADISYYASTGSRKAMIVHRLGVTQLSFDTRFSKEKIPSYANLIREISSVPDHDIMLADHAILADSYSVAVKELGIEVKFQFSPT